MRKRCVTGIRRETSGEKKSFLAERFIKRNGIEEESGAYTNSRNS
jgi:hypothetical protein